IVNIMLNLILMVPLKHAGLALATSLASAFNLTVLLILLERRRQGPSWKAFLKATSRKLPPLALLTVGSFLYLRLAPFHPQTTTFRKALWIAGALLQGGSLYLLGAWMAKSQELKVLWETLLGKTGVKEG
ncbi:MAG: hypothetical protein DRI91_05860, partial [Aquificota bacterium]